MLMGAVMGDDVRLVIMSLRLLSGDVEAHIERLASLEELDWTI